MKQLLEAYWDDLKAEPIQMTLTWLAFIVAGYYLCIGAYAFITYQPMNTGPHEVCHVDRMTDIETCGWSG